MDGWLRVGKQGAAAGCSGNFRVRETICAVRMCISWFFVWFRLYGVGCSWKLGISRCNVNKHGGSPWKGCVPTLLFSFSYISNRG